MLVSTALLLLLGVNYALADITMWRLKATGLSSNNYPATFFDLRFYDAGGTEFAGGTYSCNRGSTNINTINDASTLTTGFTFPPSGDPAVGDYIQYTCSTPCTTVGRFTLNQDGGSAQYRIQSMALEFSDDGGTTWDMAVDYIGTNSQFTDYTTNIPTANPTRSPTKSPTATPTAAPTFLEVDCTVSCSFLTGGSSDSIAAGNIIGQVKLPLNYKIAFEFVAATTGVGSEVRNLLDIRDKDTGVSLHRIGLPESSNRNTRAEYNGVVMTDWGPQMPTSYATVYVSCFISFNAGEATSWTNDNSAWFQRTIVSSAVVTGGKSYYLYASSPLDEDNPSAGGTIRNIYITCKTSFHFSGMRRYS